MAEFIRFVTGIIHILVEVSAGILLSFPWLAWALLVCGVALAVLELHFLLFASPEDIRRREEETRYVEETRRRREMSEFLQRKAARR